MFTRTLLVTLILASASLALTSRGNAGPKYDGPSAAETAWMERASRTNDIGGN